jgi:maleate isomerase
MPDKTDPSQHPSKPVKPQIGAWLNDHEFGWRARIGVINPSAGITFDHEWARMLPKGVSFHVTRLLLERGTAESLDHMASQAPEAARLLKTSRVNAVCYGCTIGSLYRGRAGEADVARRLAEAAGAPAVMMAASAAEALHSLGAKRIAVANPYTAEINALVRCYLQEWDFDVKLIEHLSIPESWSITKLTPQDVMTLALSTLRRAGTVDGLFLSCGNMRTIETIGRIESETGCPTVSSNQAMLWRVLRTVGVTDSLPGFGRLFECQPSGVSVQATS